MREIADELGLHESTVSRATSHKYMATPRGVVAFKRFFSRQLATTSGGSCSATAIRALLREFIAAEDRRNPLSDVQLTELLADRGRQSRAPDRDQVSPLDAAAGRRLPPRLSRLPRPPLRRLAVRGQRCSGARRATALASRGRCALGA